ncbi:uncharacterized protein LOC124266758 [Haliotis rubra]|uniref:uncharacterized protein LOC124266758 n=1 Tax=Haliotis rubra TaxID=36100 RepID=UPI001EE61C85|nr:uncharacterized protein LOC124266758 [Haliotis rubra]XP_046557503.1 uncharacterized protein LOC124266758 [Haliotis rubra]XP_046557504.1 uncharacterized protein LOC124266758 [Haliotis rubra]XP_046557505.1 uncharacterized protein LOC124266758 [Haliotis rubra]
MSVNGEYVPSPRPHPRVRPEAMCNAEKNRGGIEKWFDYSDNINNYSSPRPGVRNISSEAQKIADINKGSMNTMLQGYPDPPIQRQIHPRGVTGEAVEVANSNKGQDMKRLIDNYGNLEVSDRPGIKVKGSDAEEYAVRNNGTVNNVMNNYGNHPLSPAPPAKLGLGGEEVAVKHKGAGMGPVLRMEEKRSPKEIKISSLHQQSEGGWDEIPPHHRLRPEAEHIATKNSMDSMGDIMAMAVSADQSPANKRSVPKHMMITEDRRPKTSPVRTRPEAMQNYQRNRNCEMGAIMRGESQTASPQRKNNRMLQRSENW